MFCCCTSYFSSVWLQNFNLEENILKIELVKKFVDSLNNISWNHLTNQLAVCYHWPLNLQFHNRTDNKSLDFQFQHNQGPRDILAHALPWSMFWTWKREHVLTNSSMYSMAQKSVNSGFFTVYLAVFEATCTSMSE